MAIQKELIQSDYSIKIIKDLGQEYTTMNSNKKERHAIFECPFCRSNFRSLTSSIKRSNMASCGCVRKNTKYLKQSDYDLVIIRDTGTKYSINGSKNRYRHAIFKCVCGNEFEHRVDEIKSKKKTNCGCIKKKHTKSKLNQSEYSLEIIKDIGSKKPNTNSKNEYRYAIFKCKCGNEFEAMCSSIKCGNTQSCGCMTAGWKYGEWIKAGTKSNSFDSFKLYVIKCYNDDEIFYKIGKTYKTLKRRFAGYKALPYKYEIISIKTGDGQFISELEHRMHVENKDIRYVPVNKFHGMTECYHKDYGEISRNVVPIKLVETRNMV